MSYFKLISATALALTLTSYANSEPLLVESFESGDMSATNGDGFVWESGTFTSVVTAEEMIVDGGTQNITKPDGRDWTPLDGEHSLRFLYLDGKPWSEQRFDLAKGYNDLWLQYWLRVPINYFHGQDHPSNHKLFAIWMDDYSYKGVGPTVIWEFWGEKDGSSRLGYHYSEGGNKVAGEHFGLQPFISVPNDRGRWMEITIHVKASSHGMSPDGVIQLWRRWENQTRDERKLIHSKQDAVLPIPASGPNGWEKGYFMGWANAAYSENTEWLIDYITISSESLLYSKGLPNRGEAPNPPTHLGVQ